MTAVTQGSPVSTKELCQYIADSSTASASDVYATLLALPKIMELNMKNGRSVKLEGIGTFRYKVSAATAATRLDAPAGALPADNKWARPATERRGPRCFKRTASAFFNVAQGERRESSLSIPEVAKAERKASLLVFPK